MSNSFDEEAALYQQEMKAVVSNPKISEFKTWVRLGRCAVLCFVSTVKNRLLLSSYYSTNVLPTFERSLLQSKDPCRHRIYFLKSFA